MIAVNLHTNLWMPATSFCEKLRLRQPGQAAMFILFNTVTARDSWRLMSIGGRFRRMRRERGGVKKLVAPERSEGRFTLDR